MNKLLIILALIISVNGIAQDKSSKLTYKKTFNVDGGLFCDGYFRDNSLIDGSKFIYDEYGLLLRIIKYANGKPVNNAAALSIENIELKKAYLQFIGFSEPEYFSNKIYQSNLSKIEDSICNQIDSNNFMQGPWIVSASNENFVFKLETNGVAWMTKQNQHFTEYYKLKTYGILNTDSCSSIIDFTNRRLWMVDRLPTQRPTRTSKPIFSTKNILMVGSYWNSLKHGKWVYYDSLGSLEKTLHYEYGIPKGSYTTYYKNGKIKEASFWNVNHMEGSYTAYTEKGSLYLSKSFDSNGKQVGITTYFYPTGMVEIIYNSINGSQSGPVLYLSESGLIDSALICSEGFCMDVTQNHPSVDALYEIVTTANAATITKDSLMHTEINFQKLKTNQQRTASESLRRRNLLIFSAIIGALAIVLLIMAYRSRKIVKQQRDIATREKNNAEKQKLIVETKSKEIMDSINYAKRIQSAILPPAKLVKEYLKDSFILYKPKDVVAGDFYWMEHKAGKVLFAAADCTGHGVPGAMVSVVCNNALNRSVREYALTDPGEILNKTREIVIQEFDKSEDEVKDGMDIALCSLNGYKLEYAGANNPLWILRNGKLIETKANKQPIGKFDNLLPYTTHKFELEKGDSIYIFSDGYVDQFGGEKGKKFKSKAFKSLLLSIQNKTMEEQRILIDKAFETWRGNLEQIDDVCVIGVRI